MISIIQLFELESITINKGDFKHPFELIRHAKKYGILPPKETNKNKIETKEGEYLVPLKEKFKSKQLNPITGRVKGKKEIKYLKTDIPPNQRTMKNLPRYSTKKAKVRFQDWLELKKSPSYYKGLDHVSWGWGSNERCAGWSHRAVADFGIGDTVKKDTCGNIKPGTEWIIKTKEEAEHQAKAFADDVS